MAKNAKSVLGYLLSLGIAIVLLYFVFSSISIEEFLAQAERADYSYVYLSIGITIIAHVARAYRWKLLVNPTGHKTTTLSATAAVLIGYIVNLILPRLGEVTRCGVLKKVDKVPITLSLGTVISERIMDVLTLAAITLITLALEFDELSSFLMSMFIEIDGKKLLTLVLVVCIGLILSAVVGIMLYKRLVERFRTVFDQLLEGLFSLRKVKNITGFLISTVIIWLTYFFMGYVIFFAVEQTSVLSWQAGLMLLVSGGIAVTIPVQGGFGTFHSIVSSMLLLYGIDKTTGVFFATLVHSSQVAATVIFGVAGIVLAIIIGNRRKVGTGSDS